MKAAICHLCGTKLEKDHIALNKKLLGRQVKKFFCLRCFADYFSCLEEDLLIKIEEFREMGCELFKY